MPSAVPPKFGVCRTHRDRRSAVPVGTHGTETIGAALYRWRFAPEPTGRVAVASRRSVRRLPGPFPAVVAPVYTNHRVSVPTCDGYSSRSQPDMRVSGADGGRVGGTRQAPVLVQWRSVSCGGVISSGVRPRDVVDGGGAVPGGGSGWGPGGGAAVRESPRFPPGGPTDGPTADRQGMGVFRRRSVPCRGRTGGGRAWMESHQAFRRPYARGMGHAPT